MALCRLLGVSFLALFLFLPTAWTGEKAVKPVVITWHGQSFFTITSSQGTRVVLDPHAIKEYGRVLGMKADVILLSHNHDDHTQVDVIENKDKAKIIPGWTGNGKQQTWKIVDEQFRDIHIRSVGSYHDAEEGLKFGKNTIFILEVDGWRIVHLGDLGHILSPAQLKKIGEVDVLMIPVGGVYALNGTEAQQVVAQLKPKEYILPMHRGTKIYDTLLPADEFIEGQDKANVAISDDNRLELNRDPQRPRPLTVLLNYWPKVKN